MLLFTYAVFSISSWLDLTFKVVELQARLEELTRENVEMRQFGGALVAADQTNARRLQAENTAQPDTHHASFK